MHSAWQAYLILLNNIIKLFPDSTLLQVHMEALLNEWRATLTDKEKALHELAAIKLKAEQGEEGDSGSYFPEKCRAFRSWLKAKAQK